jgi:putative ABC transport system permease protein
MPLLTVGLGRVVRPLAVRAGLVEAQLAAGTLGTAPGRTAVAAGALMTALAMSVSVVVMVGSFRRTVETWIDATITADLYVSPGSRPAVGPSASFVDGEIIGRLVEVPEVAAVHLSGAGDPAVIARPVHRAPAKRNALRPRRFERPAPASRAG